MAQTWNSGHYSLHAHFVPTLGQAVLEMLAVQPGERVLDLGCGDGVLSEKIAGLGAMVIGVDASAEMVSAAKVRGIDARQMDGYHLTFQREFDAVFSNAALHWMKQDPDAVIAGVARALKPGGRFAGEFGGHGNVAAVTVALIATLERRGIESGKISNVWFFPTAEDYCARLKRAGFEGESIALIPRPTPLPTDMRGWLQTFGSAFFKQLPENQREAALDETVDRLRAVLCDEQGRWTADYVRLRFLARLPG